MTQPRTNHSSSLTAVQNSKKAGKPQPNVTIDYVSSVLANALSSFQHIAHRADAQGKTAQPGRISDFLFFLGFLILYIVAGSISAVAWTPSGTIVLH